MMASLLRMNPVVNILAARGLSKGGIVQQFVDNEVLRLSTPYTPMQNHSGGLIDSGETGTHPGDGKVIWNSPYARYLYYGKLMVGRAPKTLTETDLTYHGAPMRGAFWFERMKADHGKTLIRTASMMAGGRAR